MSQPVVRAGRGSILVSPPDPALMQALRRFVRSASGKGEYEPLYSIRKDPGGNEVLFTMPGFAERIRRMGEGRFVDERAPMPDPDLDAAKSGVHEVWHDAVEKAVKAQGGIVSVPQIFGEVGMAASIIRAFPRDRLAERGTPLSIIAVRAAEDAKRIVRELRKAFPGREIGDADSDDVVVTTYGALKDAQAFYAGVFIGCDLKDISLTRVAEPISALRNAARWGLFVSDRGGIPEFDMALEGLFGPLVAQVSYRDAVLAKVGVPITVCWLPCVRPNSGLGPAPESVLAAMATQRNDQFVGILAEIMRSVPSETGVLLCVEREELAKRVAALVPGVLSLSRKGMPTRALSAAMEDVANGTVRRAILTPGCFPKEVAHGVMVVANPFGNDIPGWSIPWRRLQRPGEKTYLVDFTHDWDLHNGRPGRLKLNDAIRRGRCQEMGFSQLKVDDLSQLPFL